MKGNERVIEIRKGNRNYVENFLRNLEGKISWSGEILEKNENGNSEAKPPEVIVTSKQFSNDYHGDYDQSMHVMKETPQEIIILNRPLGKGLEGDLRYFATAKEIDFSEIQDKASKYKQGRAA